MLTAADPERLDSAAEQLAWAVAQAKEIEARLRGLVRMGAVHGSPAEAYGRVAAAVAPALALSAEALDRDVAVMRQRAANQRQASAAGSAQPGGRSQPARPRGTVEEQRLAANRAEIDAIISGGGLDDNVRAFKDAIAKARTPAEVQALVRQHGQQLWNETTARARQGLALYESGKKLTSAELAMTDDRPLYWARLDMEAATRDWAAGHNVGAAQRDQLLQQLDQTSRGMTTTQAGAGLRRILVTGFDPFELDAEIRRGNPSGAAALALDGRVVDVNGERYQIQAAVIPVRHKEFRDGSLTTMISNAMSPTPPAAFISMSQNGGLNRFDLEQFYGRTFTAYGDNNNVSDPRPVSGSSSLAFLASTVDGSKLGQVAVTTQGATFLWDRSTSPGGVGSGGDYFSNALPRMVAEVRDKVAPTAITGHLHLPTIGTPAQGMDAFGSRRVHVVADSLNFIKAAVRK